MSLNKVDWEDSRTRVKILIPQMEKSEIVIQFKIEGFLPITRKTKL